MGLIGHYAHRTVRTKHGDYCKHGTVVMGRDSEVPHTRPYRLQYFCCFIKRHKLPTRSIAPSAGPSLGLLSVGDRVTGWPARDTEGKYPGTIIGCPDDKMV
ncbi:hypothetical protein NDU88_004294 [Pleurodeles waltl]|uniref:Uncharacterized protein n=1 Tax=Pleurodeles waltl TaxID=8319 RepID=A0AAV7UEQ2_PLEWA|nr:hypothetical protein NDU88_004294 [Pleurodeles waltl]